MPEIHPGHVTQRAGSPRAATAAPHPYAPPAADGGPRTIPASSHAKVGQPPGADPAAGVRTHPARAIWSPADRHTESADRYLAAGFHPASSGKPKSALRANSATAGPTESITLRDSRHGTRRLAAVGHSVTASRIHTASDVLKAGRPTRVAPLQGPPLVLGPAPDRRALIQRSPQPGHLGGAEPAHRPRPLPSRPARACRRPASGAATDTRTSCSPAAHASPARASRPARTSLRLTAAPSPAAPSPKQSGHHHRHISYIPA